MSFRDKGLLKFLVVLLVLFVLSACAEETAAPAEPTTPPEPVTFEVWYLSQGPEDIQLMESLSQKFAEDKPWLTVEFTAYGWEEMNTNLKLALDSGTGPDVAYCSPGANGHVIYAEAGHLVELTEYYHDRGWDEAFGEDFVMSWQKQLGGAIYGIPYEANVYGVFYNVDLFNELGLEPPESWEEMEALLAALKDAGHTPFASAGLDGWAFAHYWQNLVHATTPIEAIEGIMYNDPAVSYVEEPGFLQATEILKDWYDAGYFNEGFLGLSYADENDLFVTEQTAMVLTGSWINAFYLENSDFEVGLFVLPRVNTDLDWHALINPNNVWVISKYSENEDLAAEFLDFMLGEEVAQARWDQGTLAAYKFDTMPEPTSKLQGDVGWAVQNVGGGYSFNANLPGSEAYIFNILQEMVIEDLPPEEVVAGIEENRNELLADLE